jgi:hypothetical protein
MGMRRRADPGGRTAAVSAGTDARRASHPAEDVAPNHVHFIVRAPGIDERSGARKIDISQTNRQAFDLVRRVGEDLSARLNDTNRAVILEIKTAFWQRPPYRRGSRAPT